MLSSINMFIITPLKYIWNIKKLRQHNNICIMLFNSYINVMFRLLNILNLYSHHLSFCTHASVSSTSRILISYFSILTQGQSLASSEPKCPRQEKCNFWDEGNNGERAKQRYKKRSC